MFFSQNRTRENKACLGVGTSAGGCKERVWEVNTVEMLCTHVRKWKNETWQEGDKGEWWRG
jgi:hypothetical protein